MIEGAIFDLDGTLLDSMHVWEDIAEKYLMSMGFVPKENISEKVKFMSLYQAACYCRDNYNIELSPEEIIKGITNIVAHFYFDEVIEKKGVLSLLEKFSKSGVKMCIATATERELVEAAVRRTGIDKYVSKIFTCSEVGAGKDEPTIYTKALEYLNVKKEKTVVFEDSYHALKTAKKDGFIIAGIYDECEKETKKVKAESDFYITDYTNTNDFFEFLKSI